MLTSSVPYSSVTQVPKVPTRESFEQPPLDPIRHTQTETSINLHLSLTTTRTLTQEKQVYPLGWSQIRRSEEETLWAEHCVKAVLSTNSFSTLRHRAADPKIREQKSEVKTRETPMR